MGDVIDFSGNKKPEPPKSEPDRPCQVNFNYVKFLTREDPTTVKVWFSDGTNLTLKDSNFGVLSKEMLLRTSQNVIVNVNVPKPEGFFRKLFKRKKKLDDRRQV